ncbi:MAG: hypothetical protein ETSY2_44915 [Candidatus Entotheonella gemina]|uniref:Uncharacterized protein n=1 Tax=Candidatus Entotheonella gemina TaxID=1429439 RepID=W4LGN6_9BACT|nr:MAG: hypothetical protein ETSY2_44915 [Candidatus Entotheonella gemina]
MVLIYVIILLAIAGFSAEIPMVNGMAPAFTLTPSIADRP